MKLAGLVALALIVIVVLTEVAARVFNIGSSVPLGTTPDLFVSHPTREYELNPGFAGSSTESGELLEIDGHGFRQRVRPAPLNARRVLAIGDGQTFGLGIEAHEAWPQVTEDLLLANGHTVEFINGGVPGYDAERSVDRLVELLPKVEPDLVLWALYLGNDVSAPSLRPARRVVAGMLVEEGGDYLRSRTWLHRYSRAWRGIVEPYFHEPERSEEELRGVLRRALDWDQAFAFALTAKSPPEGVEESWSNFERALARAHSACRERGVPLEVLLIPAQIQVEPRLWVEIHDRLRIDPAEYDLERPAQRLDTLIESAGLICHDPSTRLATWSEASRDPRTQPYAGFFLSAWGQRLVGQSLAESLVEFGSL